LDFGLALALRAWPLRVEEGMVVVVNAGPVHLGGGLLREHLSRWIR